MSTMGPEAQPPVTGGGTEGGGIGTIAEPRPAESEVNQPPQTPDDEQRLGFIQRIKNWRGTKEILDIKDDIEGTVRHEAGDIGDAIESKSKAAWEKTTVFIKSERTRKVAKFAIPIAATGIMMKRRASHKEPTIMDQPRDLYNRFKGGVNNIDTIKLRNPIETLKLHSPIDIKRS